ncbi:MAG: ORC1-type DNA replication protein [Ignisphaera sp.]|nr:ORC1-type DNA replication protein [Ignisphaera sp.]
MSSDSIVENVLSRMSVFKNRSALDRSFVPDKLPHREKQLEMLTTLFRPVITDPGSVSVISLLVGDVGVGKTATAKRFGDDMVKVAKKKGINLSYIHINCHNARTLFNVVQSMARDLGLAIPIRGYSPREMMLLILNHLKKQNMYAIVTLDEFNYFVQVAGNDAVYFLLRIYDEYPESEKRLHYILITRSLEVLGQLDPATESYITKNIIKFNPYRSNELFDILAQRRELAFYENTVDDDVLTFIADIEGYDKGGKGNARVAIEMLFRAGIIADYEGAQRVTVEHVRKAVGEIREEMLIEISDTLPALQFHELVLLKAIIRKLRESGESYIKMGDAEEEYAYLCTEVYKVKPRKHTQVYEYIRNMKSLGIINTKLSGKGFRGRTTLISVPVPLEALEKRVDELIERKKVEEKEINTL